MVAQQKNLDLEMLDWVAGWFTRQLESPAGKVAREYLKERGFHAGTIRKFRIGFAPPGFSSLTDTLKEASDPESALKRAFDLGLLKEGREGTWYDTFRDRIIFPIIRPGKGATRESGEVVAFGGRHLGSVPDPSEGSSRPAPPKYINSPETRIYSKSKLLYGYHQGLDQIRRGRSLILSEGYTDVMMAHQSGFGTAVAVLGTALTVQGAQMISRKVDRVDLLFDGDEAGKKAASRCCELFLGTEVQVRVVILESGVDPCDLLISDGGKEAFEEVLASGVSSLEFLIANILQEHGFQVGESTPQIASKARRDLSKRVLQPLSLLGQIVLDEGVRQVALQTGWTEPSIHLDFQEDRQRRPVQRRPVQRQGSAQSGRRTGIEAGAGPNVAYVSQGGETVVIESQNESTAATNPDPEVEIDPSSEISSENVSQKGPLSDAIAEEEDVMLKMVVRDSSYYRPLFRIFPPQRWRSPVHRGLALVVCENREVPDLNHLTDMDQKSLLIDIQERIVKEDRWQDSSERNLMVPQYMAEILVAELERKRTRLIQKNESREVVQSINEHIQLLTSSKFLFDNSSQADEIINRFELEPEWSSADQEKRRVGEYSP